jgi:hypothetical protein
MVRFIRFRNLGLAVMILLISFIAVTGAGANGAQSIAGPQSSEIHETGSVYPLFFFNTFILAPSYLSGNSDFDTGSQGDMSLQQADSGSTNPGIPSPTQVSGSTGPIGGIVTDLNQVAPTQTAESGLKEGSTGIISGQWDSYTALNSINPVGLSYPMAAGSFSKIPSWLTIGCLFIDIIISGLLLYFALTKKI